MFLIFLCTFAESKHSERELKLWTELVSNQALLKSVESEINVLEEEEAELIETINITAVSNKCSSKYL
jgi:hypothetical protein